MTKIKYLKYRITGNVAAKAAKIIHDLPKAGTRNITAISLLYANI